MYPPTSIKFDYEDGKRRFLKVSAKPAITKTVGKGVKEIHFLILREVTGYVRNLPITGGGFSMFQLISAIQK